MNGEKPSSGDGGRFANTGWEGLGEATPSSIAKNTAERTVTNFNKFIEGWRAARAQKAQAASANKVNELTAREEEKLFAADDAITDFESARADKRTADLDLESTQKTYQEKKDTLSSLRSEYSAGNYLHAQTEQIGSILQAEGGVVKSALGAFATKFIAKLPHIEISVKTAESVASKNWGEQLHEQGIERRDAKNKVEAAKNASERFVAAKTARAEAISSLSANKNKWQAGHESIAETRKELADVKAELAEAKKQKQEADRRLSDAREVSNEAYVRYNSCMHELEEAKAVQQAQAEKLAKSQERLETLNAVAELQNKLGNKSPNSIRKDIETQLKDTRKDLILYKLAEKGATSDSDMDDDLRQEISGQCSELAIKKAALESQLGLLDQYEELRRGKVETVAANPVARKSIINVFKRAIQSSLAAVIR